MKRGGDKFAFFRQSGWMIVATVAGGVFMSAVHMIVNKPMEKSEYAVFNTLLRIFLLMGFPAGGLQVVFAQQAAAALTDQDLRRLSGTTRAVLRGTLFAWMVVAALILLNQGGLLALLKISNPAALWVTLLLGLASLWAPVIKGLLQGRQHFAGLGSILMLDGIGRFTAIVVIVELGGQAAGGVTGALAGQVLMLAVGGWLVRTILTGPGAPFDWGPWLRKVLPLTGGVGVVLFMGSADVVYVQSVFDENVTPFYAPAAMIGLALFSFTTPLASVMFPKLVQSAARTEKSDALGQALISTAVVGGAAALACTVLPKLPLQIIYFRNSDYWNSAPLVPWFAWALLPLIVANVLISHQLAHDRFRVVPWSLLIALGYGTALFALKDRLQTPANFSVKDPGSFAALLSAYKIVIGTLGIFNLLLLVAAIVCSYEAKPRRP